MNATERLRSILDRQIAFALAANQQDHIGGQHWQVTEAEIEVFMLPPKTAAKLCLVWEAYENALGISTDMGNTALFAGLRDEHPFLAHAMRGGDEGYDAPFISP